MARIKGSPKTGGRVKGTPNKITTDLREMALAALDEAGGKTYLLNQATTNPNAFLSLLGKCLPKDVNATVSGSIDLPTEFVIKFVKE